MKKLLFILSMITCTTHVFSQDVIVKKDGSTIVSKVLEINEDNIKYKKFSNLNGPTYTVNMAEVTSVNYENGEKDVFESKKPVAQSGLIEKQGDSRNAELLNLYNRSYNPSDRVKRKNSSAKDYLIIFGITSNSILSNDDIEMTLERAYKRDDSYRIRLYNKTDRTIYIDRSNCFKTYNNGKYRSFYNGEVVTTVSVNLNKNSKGLGERLGIGGYVGKVLDESSKENDAPNSVVKTTMEQRFMAIPPRGTQYLTIQNVEDNELKDLYEDFAFKGFNISAKDVKRYNWESSAILGIKPGLIDKGVTIAYTEQESPWVFGYHVKYSMDESFTTYSTLKADLFIHQLIGCQQIVWNSESREKYIEGFDNYTILGYYYSIR